MSCGSVSLPAGSVFEITAETDRADAACSWVLLQEKTLLLANRNRTMQYRFTAPGTYTLNAETASTDRSQIHRIIVTIQVTPPAGPILLPEQSASAQEHAIVDADRGKAREDAGHCTLHDVRPRHAGEHRERGHLHHEHAGRDGDERAEAVTRRGGQAEDGQHDVLDEDAGQQAGAADRGQGFEGGCVEVHDSPPRSMWSCASGSGSGRGTRSFFGPGSGSSSGGGGGAGWSCASSVMSHRQSEHFLRATAGGHLTMGLVQFDADGPATELARSHQR